MRSYRMALVVFTCLLTVASMTPASAAPRTYTASLSGSQEVPANDSNAAGQAIFTVAKDGQSIEYKVIASNIQNVHMAHIHLGPAGANGGVVVWLYPSGPPPILIEGRSSGILATGTITAASLVGSLSGQPLSALIDAFDSGNAYVNVHTSQFPGGEIRGQI
jgi:hypothetical protein